MFYANVLGNGVAAPGTAAQCQGWCQLKVVQVTDTTVSRWGVDQDSACLHCFSMFHDLFFLCRMDIQCSGVSVTAIFYQTFCFGKRFVKVFCTVHSQNWRKFFMCKFFGDINRLYLTDQNLGLFWNVYACHLCDGVCGLTNNLCVERAVNQDGVTNLVNFVTFEEIASSIFKFFSYCVIDIANNGYRLLGSADHTVIECLGVDNGVNCHLNISSFINDNWCIAGTNAQSRFAGGVCCLNHARTTGCEDGIGFTHNLIGQFQAWNIDPADNVFRCTCRYCCFINNFRCCNRRSLCTWMWADDDSISGL